MTKKLSPYQIILRDSNGSESYRVSESFFKTLREAVEPFRSKIEPSKTVKCIETGEVFKSATYAKKWLITTGITDSCLADVVVKSACKGRRKLAFGYHWEFVKENETTS